MAGGLSLWVFPALFIQEPWLRVINLLVAPCVAGFVMSALGNYRRRKGQELLRLDTFVYGAVFAFGMALVRFMGGH